MTTPEDGQQWNTPEHYYDRLRELTARTYQRDRDYQQRQQLYLIGRASTEITLPPGVLAALLADRLLTPERPPATTADYVADLMRWREAIAGGHGGGSLRNAVAATLGLGDSQDDRDRALLLKACALILTGDNAAARALLTAGADLHADHLPYSDLPSPALPMLDWLAQADCDADLLVMAVRAHLIDKPGLAEEAIARTAGWARRQGRGDFADAVERAAVERPTETPRQRSRRLGLDGLDPMMTLVGLWDTQSHMVNLDGPLPPCALRIPAVITTLEGDEPPMVAADLPGGGSIRAALHPALVGPLSPVLHPGTLVHLTVSLTGALNGLAVTAVVTAVDPHPRGPVELTGPDSVEDEEEWEDYGETEIDLGYAGEAHRWPRFEPAAEQIQRWARVDQKDLLAARRVVDAAHPAAVPPARAPGSSSYRKHFLVLSHFAGALPTPGGWRDLAVTIWSGTPAYRYPLLARMPPYLVAQLGGDVSYLQPLLDGDQAELDTLSLVAARFVGVTEDSRQAGWRPGQLAKARLQSGLRLAALYPYFDLGFEDPYVAAAFRDAGWSAEQVSETRSEYLTVRTYVQYPYYPQRRRKSPHLRRDLVGGLPALATAGTPLPQALDHLFDRGN